MPLRSHIANSVYRRTSLPFRIAFKAVAHARTRRPFRHFVSGDQDAFLTLHTREYHTELWKFGYHRMYDLMSHLDPLLDRAPLKVLSIGPRTEIELYYLWLIFGFSWHNIVGVDLVSPNATIEVGDMGERLPFADDSFDVIVASHSLEKSRDLTRTRDEIRRVARSGAHICVAGDRVPEAQWSQHTDPPMQFFRDGAYGFIELYELAPVDIDYVNARAPSGFDIIFRVSKT